MFQGLYTSASGMIVHQTAFDVISNNISNVNSIGYKRHDTIFEELFNKSYNNPQININPLQQGIGANVANVRKIMNSENYISTDRVTDLAINGNGFFIVKDKIENKTYYTKVGRFNFDCGAFSKEDGYPQIDNNGKIIYYSGNPTLIKPLNLVTADGGFVQGWLADKNGNINSASQPTDIIIDQDKFLMPASATTYTSLENNLDSTLSLSRFNTSVLTLSKYDNTEISSDSVNGLLKIRGDSLDTRQGKYKININPDGSALVNFIPANSETEEIYEFSAGTIPIDSTTPIKTTQLIPGIEMTIGADISKPIYAEITNSGTLITNGYSTETVIYDNTGQPHNLLLRFYRIGTNQWVWEPKLYEIETFKGTGSAATITVNDTINEERTIGIKVINTLTNKSETISRDDIEIFEGNKIVIKRAIGENEKIEVEYYSLDDGLAKTATFTSTEIAESFVLDNIPDVSSIQIYVDGSSEPLPSNYYEVHNNVIVPVDLNGDGIKDEPFVGAGVSVKIKYLCADSIISSTRKNKDVFEGSGKVETITLADEIDTSKNISIIVTNKNTGSTRTLSISDFEVEGNLLKPIDKDGDGILDSPVIGIDEIMTIDYTVKDNPISQVEEINYNGKSHIKLSGNPRPNTLKLYTDDGKEIDSNNYVIANNEVIFIDGDKDGIINLPTTTKIRAEYLIDDKEQIKLNFNKAGEMNGGTTIATLQFNTKYPMTFNVDMSNVFQFAGYSDLQFDKVDGHSAGYLKELGVDQYGRIIGYYSNDISKNIAGIALATFSNPQDLTSAGNGNYINNSNTITAKIVEADPYGAGGSILSHTLEGSNVDLAEELANLIVMQRGFQLSARGVTTVSDLIANAINLKR
ncbi:MAG TPA: flagellar hook-basal body complex protein [bacterium]|nr:flagellar hook-basal body complex protein [bacterium]HOL47072.1 flagellar hook-basal body complex protein [bacterium]HPQ18972.1 flagellar hook-basal body complex protein [bacterium]